MKNIGCAAIMQCIIFTLFLLYGIIVYRFFYWIGSVFSISYSNLVLAIYIVVGMLCVAVPTLVFYFRYNVSIVSCFCTLPIVFTLSLFIHPEGLYGLMPTHFNGPINDVHIAIGITGQIAVVEIFFSIMCAFIRKLRNFIVSKN